MPSDHASNDKTTEAADASNSRRESDGKVGSISIVLKNFHGLIPGFRGGVFTVD